MKDILAFFSEHTFITFITVILVMSFLHSLFISLPNRIIRHWNIRKHGYPPPHCDADGDFKSKDEVQS